MKMEKLPQIPTTMYTPEELILFAGASYESITNAIDMGDVEIMDNTQLN